MIEELPLSKYPDEALADLTPQALLALMTRNDDRVPRNVIDECARRGDEMADLLARVIHDRRWNTGELEPGEWWLRLHAAMILGLMQGSRAGMLLAELMERIDDFEDEDLHDWLTGYWPALFRNKPDEAIEAVRALAEDRDVSWWVRVDAAHVVIAAAETQGADALDRALEWAAGLAFDDSEPPGLRGLLGNTLLDHARPQDRPQLEALADQQPHRDRIFGRTDIARVYAGERSEPLWHRMRDPWSFYTPERAAERQRVLDEEEEPIEPFVRSAPKVGRNDPCPCGSGRKYKKCCLGNETPSR
jgi:hypothetical protein